MKKYTKTIALGLALIGLLAVLTACTSSKEPAIKVGDDEVPSFYTLVGEKKIVGSAVSTDLTEGRSDRTITYQSASISQDEMQQYILGLEAEGFMQITDTIADGERQVLDMGKTSVTEGKIVVVNIDFNPGGSTVLTYINLPGTVTRKAE